MFVNDTGHLPDSGRVCVAGFQAEPAGPRIFYSLEIHAARAEVEPMAEPRNPAHVLGVGCEIQSVKGPVFAAYSPHPANASIPRPTTRSGLYVLVDGAVYSVKAENIGTSIRRGFSTRHSPCCGRSSATHGRVSVALVQGAVRSRLRATCARRISCARCPRWSAITADPPAARMRRCPLQSMGQGIAFGMRVLPGRLGLRAPSSMPRHQVSIAKSSAGSTGPRAAAR